MLLDNSTLAAFSRCHTYGAARYWLHRQFNNDGAAATLGKAAHAIAQSYLSGRPTGDAIIRGIELLHNHAAVIGNEYATLDLDKNITKLRSFIANFISEYPIVITQSGPVIYYPRSNRPRWYVRHTEIPFAWPLGNSHHTYVGSLDAIVQDDIGAWSVWELKTSTKATHHNWQESWKMSTQPKGYVWATKEHTESQVRGAIIIPFSTAALDVKPQQPIAIRYTPEQLDQWLSDTISYCDWLEAIASEAGIAFDAEGRAIAPDGPEITARALKVLSMSIPTGSYSGLCTGNAFGRCSMFDICVSRYAKGYVEAQTQYSVWNPLLEYSRKEAC